MKKNFLTFTLAFLLAFVGFAQEETSCFPKPQSPPQLVNDFANVLRPETRQLLERELVNFNDTTSTQITIVTLNDLCDYEPATFAFAIGEKWGVGDAKFDNGIVILLKPKTSDSKGEVYIAPGYGLEGVLPDAIGKRIVENEMIPHFKQNDYDGGIVAAVKIIIDITGGEYSADSYSKKAGSFPLFPIIFILFFVIIMFASIFGRAKRYSKLNNVNLLTALMLMGSMSGRHGGHYSNFSSGRGGFGGGGGGGFGGFGGGSFGGGGAGGSW